MRRAAALLVPALVILGGLAVASPAAAAPISYAGTTIDVVLQPSGTSTVNSGVAYLPESGGGMVATLGAPIATDVLVNYYGDGVGILADCTIPAGSTSCGDSIGSVIPGDYPVHTSLTTNATTTLIPGTLIAVDNVAPEVSVEWQDASGAWIDGSGTGIILMPPTATRCVVTNPSNAAFEFDGFGGFIDVSVGLDTSVPITGALGAGETRYYPLGTVTAPGITSISCSGSVEFPDSTTSGNGNGGGAFVLGGSIDVAPALAAGRTVTVTASDIDPAFPGPYVILFDGVEVAGSPVTLDPDAGFSIDVEIPSGLAPGIHALEIVVTMGEQDIVLAYFPLEIAAPAALAATGSDPFVAGGAGLLVLLVGAAAVLVARRATA